MTKRESNRRAAYQMKPVVSVIIPVYNVEQYLDTCLQSIRNQSLGDIEIILVDDGSPDRCPEMCDNYARTDSRIRVVHKENAGLGYARNTGLDYACGQWVCFVDSDDCLALNALKTCVDIAERAGVDQVRYLLKRCGEHIHGHAVETKGGNEYQVLDKFPEKAMPMLAETMAVSELATDRILANASACAGLYRRDAIIRSGVRFHSERELISEDYVFNIEFAAKSGAIAYTSYPFYFYRDNHMSLSKMYKADRIERSVVFSRFLRTRLSELGYPDAELIAVGNMIGNLRSHLRHIYASDFSQAEKRRLHSLAVNHPYISQIAEMGVYRQLSLLQRMAFRFRKSYVVSRVLNEGRDWIRRLIHR